MKFKIILILILFILGLSLLSSSVQALDVTADSGHAQDIQNAVDQVAAAGGGNVYIPAGTWNFVEVGEPWMTVNIPVGVNLFGAPTERDSNDQVIEWKSILTMPWDVPTDRVWFQIVGNSDPNKHSRFSDIKLVGYRDIDHSSTSVHRALIVTNVIDFRVDHCFFKHTTGGIITEGHYCCGVIDHCKFINEYGIPDPYEDLTIGYGVMVGRADPEYEWEDMKDVVGHYNDYTVFIEDCYFSKWRHCVVGNWGAHYVFRHNIIQYDFAYGSIDAHPAYEGVGCRAVEVYENQIIEPDMWYEWQGWASEIKSGGGCMFNNTVTDYNLFTYLYECKDLYIWNNDIDGAQLVDHGGNVQQNVNYFLYAPSWYTPYPYPHPLTLEDGTTTTTSTTTTSSIATTTTTTSSTSTSTTILSTTSTSTTIPSGQVTISGQLRNSTGTIQANISVYNQGTNRINTSQITSNGNYSLAVWPKIYDLQYNILQFFIQNFFIKLISFNVNSNIINVVNYVNCYSVENKVYFRVNITGNQEIQVYSEQEPKAVKVNGIDLTKGALPLSANQWYYSPTEKRLYLIASPVLPTTTTSTTTTISGTTSTTTISSTTTTTIVTTTTSSTTTTVPVGEKTFGKTDISSSYTWSCCTNRKYGCRYQLTENGIVSKITAYIAGDEVTAHVKAGIYRDNSGTPSTLVGESEEVMVPPIDGWYEFNFPFPISLLAGYYWLSILQLEKIVIFYDSGTINQFAENGDSYSDGFSNPFGGSNYEDWAMSIYATYTPS